MEPTNLKWWKSEKRYMGSAILQCETCAQFVPIKEGFAPVPRECPSCKDIKRRKTQLQEKQNDSR